MAQIDLVGREYELGVVLGRILGALRWLDRALAVRGQHAVCHRSAQSLGAEVMRDIGMGPEFQDYASSRAVVGQSARHLHRVAEAERWTFGREGQESHLRRWARLHTSQE